MLASQAAALLAIDPHLGGIVLRAGAGPVRDARLAQFPALAPPGAPIRRAPVGVADDALFGGLDLAATLRSGRAIATGGLLAQCDGGVLILPMAERVTGAGAARIAGVLDRGEVATERDGFSRRAPTRFSVVALDEGQGEDEYAPPALADRLALHLDLDAVSFRDIEPCAFDSGEVSAARLHLASATAGPEIVAALVEAAAQLGADSFRAPLKSNNRTSRWPPRSCWRLAPEPSPRRRRAPPGANRPARPPTPLKGRAPARKTPPTKSRRRS